MSALQRELMEKRMNESLEKLYDSLRVMICRSIYPGAIFHDQPED